MPEEHTIKFKYIFPDDYNPIYVNGIVGGITPKAEIVINFFLERHALPDSQSYKIESDGSLGEEIKSEPQDLKSSMVRFVGTGIILNYQSAKAFIQWLNSQTEILEKAMKQDEKMNK